MFHQNHCLFKEGKKENKFLISVSFFSALNPKTTLINPVKESHVKVSGRGLTQLKITGASGPVHHSNKHDQITCITINPDKLILPRH